MVSPKDFLLTLFTSLIQLILFITAVLLLWNPAVSKGTFSAIHPLYFLILTIAVPVVVVSPSAFLSYALDGNRIQSVFLSITPIIGLILLLLLKAIASFPSHTLAITVGFSLWIFLFLTVASVALMGGKRFRARHRERSPGVRRIDRPEEPGTKETSRENRSEVA